MNNKQLAIYTFITLGWILFLPLLGIDSDAIFIAGALAGLVLGAMGLSRLYLRNKKAFFPYFAGTVMFAFWTFAFIDADFLTLIGPIYVLVLTITAVKLYRI